MSTLPHEVGHFFNLDHTHRSFNKGNCRREPISRTRTYPFFQICAFGGGGLSSEIMCESTGDALDDTPADPNLISNYSCSYTLGGTDLYSDSYTNPPVGASQPDTRNVMSYNADDDCINFFSRKQIAVMLHSIYRGRHSEKKNYWQNRDGIFDSFEPDNNQLYSRSIALGEIQARSFHQQYNGSGNNWSQCDVDWVRFTPSCSGSYTVETSERAYTVKANTKLTLFNSALNQLAQNDDISTSNHFSKITYNFVNGQEYFIRVENMSQNVTGYYNLLIGNPFSNPLSISGNDNLCPSGSYSVTGLPTGATVSWSAWPLNMVSFNNCTDCLQPTITPTVSSGTVTVTATVSVTVCGTVFTKSISKQMYIGPPDNSKLLINSQYVYAGNPVDLGVEFEEIGYCTLLNAGVTDVQWDIASSYPFYVDSYYSSLGCADVINSGRTVSFSDGHGSYTIYIRVKVINACGWSDWSAYFPISVIDDGWGFMASPNPSNGSIVVALNETTIKNSKSMAIREIQVTDKLGNIVKKFKYVTATKSIKLDINDLKQDVYFIRVFNGKEWKTRSIIKE